jgi:hypothetical protein
MSKVKIEGNASGTGTFTIAAPNTNTDRTLTLPDGAGELLLANGDGSQLTGIGGGTSVAIIEEVTTGTNGDTTNGTWTTRVLNTITADDDSIVTSLSSNQFVLEAGTYVIQWSTYFNTTGDNQTRLKNVTDTTYMYGQSSWANLTNYYGAVNPSGNATFTISAQKTFQLEYIANSTGGTYPYRLGWSQTDNGVDDIWTTVLISKIG